MSDNQEETEHIWTCTLVVRGKLPEGADLPMREVLRLAIVSMTGSHPEVMFTGWGGQLTPSERKILEENRNQNVPGNNQVP